MPNTFLNTARTVAATSNPQANVAQVNNSNTAMQPQSINPSMPQSINQPQPIANNNAISPITIPIQIQPVAPATPTQGIAPVSNNNLQAISTQNQNVISSAPTPQTYEPSSTNNNVVDFNQIYRAYQSQYGNSQNANVNASGVKKTTIGTTIVTPQTKNLNTIKGQYQSAYSDTMNSLLQKMLEGLDSIESGSFYDPTQDRALQVASEYAANSTLQSLAGSGVLNSSATAERVARVVSELIPQYEKLAYERKIAYLGQLADTAQMIQSYDAQQFEYWKDAKDREFQEKEFEFNKKQAELENAWKRVDELGYVDNNAAAVLGVKAGTLSGQAREAKEQREFELQKMREQAQIEYENNKALYELRSQLDKDYADYEYQLQQKYSTIINSSGSAGSSTSSNTDQISMSSYESLIKERWIQEDDITGEKTIDNDAIWNYIEDELNAGRMSENTARLLVTKYNLTEPKNSENTDLHISFLQGPGIKNNIRDDLTGKLYSNMEDLFRDRANM